MKGPPTPRRGSSKGTQSGYATLARRYLRELKSVRLARYTAMAQWHRTMTSQAIRMGTTADMPGPAKTLAVVVLAVAFGACRDGRENAAIQATYDDTGYLRTLTFDSDRNGTPDAWSQMQGSTIARIDIDADEDGSIDRWEYYDSNQQLVSVGLSRSRDGRVARSGRVLVAGVERQSSTARTLQASDQTGNAAHEERREDPSEQDLHPQRPSCHLCQHRRRGPGVWLPLVGLP